MGVASGCSSWSRSPNELLLTWFLQCCVPIVGLFTLIARINHSCDPNAEVRSQEYTDCHVDLVAKRPIEPGEEITISYIRESTAKVKRLRALESKYLFACDCSKCAKKS
jgi:hypothetical protein